MFNRNTPKVTDAQKKELQALQKDFSPKIAKILTDAQKTSDRGLQERSTCRGYWTRRTTKAGNTLFRATRYALNHPAFAGKTFKPGKTLVEISEEFDKEKSKADAAASVKSAVAK